MRIAIELDDQLHGMAIKVDSVRTHGMLPAKAHIADALGAQLSPQQPLRGCLVLAQESDLLVGRGKPSPNPSQGEGDR